MANTGHDWGSWVAVDAAITLTTGGTVQDTSAAQSNDIKSACEISIDADYSNHAKATGGLKIYIFRDVDGSDFEDFDDAGWSFEMPFTQNGTNRRTFSVPPDAVGDFKIGLEWLNTTGGSSVTVATGIRQADVPVAS
jgi:hypothetical protein